MRAWVLAAFAIGTVASACRSRALDPVDQGTIDGGAGARDGGAGGAGGTATDGGFDRGNILPTLTIGAPCASAGDCASGFCADGVCCESACTGECFRCNGVGGPGICVSRLAGDRARTPTFCPATSPSTCGWDGTCDGVGACRRWPVNTVCVPGQCEGDAVVGVYTCDDNGRCRPGATFICAPYMCDPATAACRTGCATDAECPGSYCETWGSCHVNSSVRCTRNEQCASAFCSNGVCCQTACTDPCMSCNEPRREGTCSPRAAGCPVVDAGAPPN